VGFVWHFFLNMDRHGRLTDCFEGAGGNAAAATYIVISDQSRGQGHGRRLMTLLEIEAKRLGYHYIYLWTHTAIDFYNKLDYRECQRVSLYRASLKRLQVEEISALERMLHKKHVSCSNSKSKATKETILLPPSDGNDATTDDVWLRKRLVEHVGSIQISLEQRLDELLTFVSQQRNQQSTRPIPTMELEWRYQLVQVPWQSQIGPSCGLAALRMVRDYLHESSLLKNNPQQPANNNMPSLLTAARTLGYSDDGEIFNANHLLDLAETVCGLNVNMCHLSSLTAIDISSTLSKGGVWIVPYDSNARTRLPTTLDGNSAHYGIIVGLVAGFPIHQQDDTVPRDVDSAYHNESNSAPGNSPRLHLLEDPSSLVAAAAQVYLCVQHSLSQRFSIASLEDFWKSNLQLVSVDKYKNGRLDLRDRIIECRGVLQEEEEE
jgi:hypothetical protein